MTFTEIEDSVVYKMSDTIAAINPLAPPLIMSSGVPRSDGLHLTQITGDMFGYKHDEGDTDGNERMALGFCWELLLSSFIGQVFHQEDLNDAGVLIHPGEFEKDGIRLSPDCVWAYDEILEEWKATWTSSLRPLSDHTTWIWQSKAYCYVLGFKKVRFRILHLNGNYHKGSGRCKDGPCVKTWLVEYTDAELEQNWDNIVQHAKQRGWL